MSRLLLSMLLIYVSQPLVAINGLIGSINRTSDDIHIKPIISTKNFSYNPFVRVNFTTYELQIVITWVGAILHLKYQQSILIQPLNFISENNYISDISTAKDLSGNIIVPGLMDGNESRQIGEPKLDAFKSWNIKISLSTAK